MGWCSKACTILQLSSDQQQTEWNDHLLCLSYNTPVNTILKGDLATSFVFFPARTTCYCLALGLWCTQNPRSHPAELPCSHLFPVMWEPTCSHGSLIPPHSTKGSLAARMPLHRPWCVNNCFYTSLLTMCILKLFSLFISFSGANSSVLLGGSSGLSPHQLLSLLCSFLRR